MASQTPLSNAGTDIGEQLDPTYFRREGYFVVRPQSPRFFERVEQAAEVFERLHRELPSNVLHRGFQGKNGSFRHLNYVHLKDGVFESIIRSDEVSALTRLVLGPGRQFVTHSKVSYKQRGPNLDWFPHQDNGYKLISGQSVGDGLTVAVFLEDADERNGTIQVLPRSHARGTLPHRHQRENSDGSGQVVVDRLPDIPPRTIAAKKGDILVFHLDTIHQSMSNMTDGLRPIFIFQIEPYARLAHDNWGNPPIILNGALAPLEEILTRAVGLPTRVRAMVGGVEVLRRVYRRVKYRAIR